MIGKPEGLCLGQSRNPSTGTLYNVPRLRTDIWNRIRDSARRLRKVADRSDEATDLKRICTEGFEFLKLIEPYNAFPGKLVLEQVRRHFERGKYEPFARQVIRLVRLMNTNAYRKIDLTTSNLNDYSDLLNISNLSEAIHSRIRQERRPYFEVLVVDDLSTQEEMDLRVHMRELRQPEDKFIYEVVVVPTFEDALLASMNNFNLETCVIRNTFPFASPNQMEMLHAIYAVLETTAKAMAAMMPGERTMVLGRVLKRLRPELDLFLVTDAPVEDVAGEPTRNFRRVFYQQDDYHDLHLSILKGLHERYQTPFFDALRSYSQKPTGMFHALPISRGRTIAKSHWIKDMGRFYGKNIFLAETSATTGGLDSLLQPTGSLKSAQELAGRAFGSRHTYFVTNGTSTANKIVMQALIRPGDIVLLAHDCHKSHPYAVILAGAMPVYLDAYPLTEYSMYGGVPLRSIKKHLLELKRAGKLDRVRMLLLTNLTFDGITYDPIRIMEEVLAIKPDMIFVWDEAWFAYGRFSPVLRRRTAMESTRRLLERLRSDTYREEYRAWKTRFDEADPDDDATWLDQRLMAEPGRARLRVYATQSTHKTLTALRQGSMIHVHDQDFEQHVQEVFHEAFMTHTSTSPNYQILASMDVGRRQVELEGYELIEKSIELAMTVRERITSDDRLQKYFRVLAPEDMVPSAYRPSGLEFYFDPERGWSNMEDAWRQDEFVLDPTRVTLHIGRTGMDGDTFKKLLMDRYDIHINKTSRNTVLFLVHIGMTRGTVAHLIKVLTQIAQDLDDRLEHQNAAHQKAHERKVASLTEELPPLPNFSRFHRAFLPTRDSTTPEGDMRSAFFLAYDDIACEFLMLDGAIKRAVESGREVVSASFVTPYPPGFPILVPGQVLSTEILTYLKALDVKEIHGYDPAYGLRVFTEAALEQLEQTEPPARTSIPRPQGVTA